MKMDIWVAGTLNQLFMRDSSTQIKLSKKKKKKKKNEVVCGKTLFFVIGPFHIFCIPRPFFLSTSF